MFLLDWSERHEKEMVILAFIGPLICFDIHKDWEVAKFDITYTWSVCCVWVSLYPNYILQATISCDTVMQKSLGANTNFLQFVSGLKFSELYYQIYN